MTPKEAEMTEVLLLHRWVLAQYGDSIYKPDLYKYIDDRLAELNPPGVDK